MPRPTLRFPSVQNVCPVRELFNEKRPHAPPPRSGWTSLQKVHKSHCTHETDPATWPAWPVHALLQPGQEGVQLRLHGQQLVADLLLARVGHALQGRRRRAERVHLHQRAVVKRDGDEPA